MKIMIIGANGRQGTMLCREACDRGHEVTAVVLDGAANETRVFAVLHKSLFNLTADDISGYGAVISAFGSGLDADPKLNRDAIDHLIAIGEQSGARILFNGGAGSLYTDKTRTERVWQSESHPDCLRRISEQMTLGLEDIGRSSLRGWTYVSPSLNFIFDGKRTGTYMLGGDVVLLNERGESEISYADFAIAMIDEAETCTHPDSHITVCKK